MNLTIKAKLIIGFVLAISATFVLTAVDIYSVSKGTNDLAYVYENQMLPTTALQEIDSDIKEIRFRMAGVLLDQMPAAGSRNHIKEVRGRILEDWKKFKSATAENAFSDDAKKNIEKIDKQIILLPAFLDKLDSAYEKDQKSLLTPMLEDEWPAFQSGLIKQISQLLPEQQQAVKQTYESGRANGKRLMTVGVSIFIISALILVVFGWMILARIKQGLHILKSSFEQIAQGNLKIRTTHSSHDELGHMEKLLEETAERLQLIVGSVKSAADKAVQSSTLLADQVDKLIARDKQLSARVTSVSANMEEITVSNSEVAEMAKNASVAVNHNEELARQGNLNVSQTMTVTENVVSTVNNSVTIVTQLNLSIQKINQISTVIKEIADQTNLLALNAAIEAARAGEQGRGFAVVADEVRKLAERTSVSTIEISGVVNSIRSEVDQSISAMSKIEAEVKSGATLSQRTGDALQNIVEAASQATTLVDNIAQSTKEQASATEDVAHNMEEISVLSEQNEAGVQDVAKIANRLSEIANELESVVGQFKY
jgi:methyl-accepting chemotaxis protein